MNAAKTLADSPPTPLGGGLEEDALLERLEAAFGQSFAVLDATRGVLERVTADWPRVDVFRWLPLCEHVARRGRPEIVEEHAPLTLLAVPLPAGELAPPRTAVAVLLTDPCPSQGAIDSAARVFGIDPAWLARWAAGRKPWPAHASLPLAAALAEAHAARSATMLTKRQLSDVSSQLLATFDELNLLHQLTEWLSLGRNEQDLTEQAVQWLGEVIPADSVVAWFETREGRHLSAVGREPAVRVGELEEFFRGLGPQATRRALVLNRDRTSSPTWARPEVREVVTAPIVSNHRTIGWVAAFNYRPRRGSNAGEFGTVEASLLSSVATLVGVHAGNRDLYSQQNALFESAVHALTSAIDAKDPYTCGHSDRVARIAVRLAQGVGCDTAELNAVYLGGLLHDIGKIGVNDAVLRKPGHLTDDEFAHIRQHPELGAEILRGVPQLAHVLPIVLHHHEAWDGGGYPAGMEGDEIPRLARVTAVADALDAMASDRPYRKGMPLEKVEEILREGAGKQWDPDVVGAYFSAREEIQSICRIDREPMSLDVGSWCEAPGQAVSA